MANMRRATAEMTVAKACDMVAGEHGHCHGPTNAFAGVKLVCGTGVGLVKVHRRLSWGRRGCMGAAGGMGIE